MKAKLDHLILAEGEVTGHAHRATSGVLYDHKGTIELHPEGDTQITHEEHAPTPVLDRPYTVSRVQEFDHAAEEARNVAD